MTKDDDGEFYMSFRDFLLYFGELEICHLTPESVSIEDANKQFEVFSWHSEWRRGVTAGGCGNDGGKRSFATNPQVALNAGSLLFSDPVFGIRITINIRNGKC